MFSVDEILTRGCGSCGQHDVEAIIVKVKHNPRDLSGGISDKGTIGLPIHY